MCADKRDAKPSFILSLLQNKCPRCRRGRLYRFGNPYHFKSFMQMHEQCPVCGQPLDMEPGFYYGTNLVSYALAVLITIIFFVLWFLFIGFSLHDKRFFLWMSIDVVLLILLQPVLMRLSRTVWLSFFVPYSRRWYEGDIIKPERFNKEQQHNW